MPNNKRKDKKERIKLFSLHIHMEPDGRITGKAINNFRKCELFTHENRVVIGNIAGALQQTAEQYFEMLSAEGNVEASLIKDDKAEVQAHH